MSSGMVSASGRNRLDLRTTTRQYKRSRYGVRNWCCYFSGRTTTTVTAPAAAPVDYNRDAPDLPRVCAVGLALITLLPVRLGGAITLWSLPKAAPSWAGWGMLGLFVGGLMVLGGLRFSGHSDGFVLRAVASYRAH